MNILVNCNELINPAFATLEEIGGPESYLLYHKLRLYLKEHRTDKIYRANITGLGTTLRSTHQKLLKLLEIASDIPSLIIAKGQYWQFPEITKELTTLELRSRGAQGHLNKGKDQGKDQGKDLIVNSIKEGESERKPKPISELGAVLIPESLKQPHHLEAWKSYLEYKQSTKHKFKGVKPAQMFLKRWSSRPNEFVEALEQTITAQWQAPPWDKTYHPTQSPTPTQNLTQKDFLRLPNWMKKEMHLEALGKKIEEEEAAKNNLKTLEISNDKQEGNVQLVKSLIFDVSKR